ncbi:hypothetical protein HanHA300_Chr01g0004091 [Helianthus annuus]|nr:hypothetical protein HanHA300_Chr01g0004091 [Helianthus annuus]
MLQAWWIRRWYFLYISACIVLHDIPLFRSFNLDLYIFANDIIFIRLFFTKQFISYNLFLLGYSFNHTLFFYTYILTDLLSLFKHFISKHLNWIHDKFSFNIFLNLSHESYFHKTYVSHRHFYADVPIFTCVSGANA